jgi:hypothetical protein
MSRGLLVAACAALLFAPECRAGDAPDFRARLANLNVGETLRDENIGLVAKFLQKSAGKAEADGWVEAKSLGCGFTVSLPGPFDEIDQQAPTTDGGTVHIVALRVPLPEGAKMVVACWSPWNPKLRYRFADSLVEGSLLDDQLLDSREIARTGYRATRSEIARRDVLGSVELFFAGERAYELIVEYPPAARAAVEPLSERFFASFRPPRP